MPVNQSEIAEYGITQAIVNQLIKRNVCNKFVSIIKLNLLCKNNKSRIKLTFIVVGNKEVDIIPMTLTPTRKRARFMDFTTPLLIDHGRLMLRYPEEESRLGAVLQPFSLLVIGVCEKKKHERINYDSMHISS